METAKRAINCYSLKVLKAPFYKKIIKKKLLKNSLKRTHKIWSRILPSYYRAYKLPTGGDVFIDIAESSMMFSRVTGDFEPQKHQALDFFLQEGDDFIDIGANKGEFAIHAALSVGTRGKVVAFEPEPLNCKWIRKSIDLSGVNNVVLEEAAIGTEEETMNLFIGENSGWHSLVASEQNLKKASIAVSVFSLDNYLRKHPLPNLKAIKVDVEGFEKEVLLGARNTLNENNGLIFFLDIHPAHGVKHYEIYEILRGFGFSLYKEEYPFNLPIKESQTPLEIVAIKEKGTTTHLKKNEVR